MERPSPGSGHLNSFARAGASDDRVAIVRLEQFYPFPKARIEEVFASYPNATELFWTQEEPQNMGGWTFVQPRLEEIKGNLALRYVGRAASASPATGSYSIHNLEQEKLVRESVTEEPEVSEKIAPAGA